MLSEGVRECSQRAATDKQQQQARRRELGPVHVELRGDRDVGEGDDVGALRPHGLAV